MRQHTSTVKFKLLENGKSSINQVLAQRPDLTESEQLILNNADTALKAILALHPKISDELKTRLVADRDPSVRKSLAENYSLIKEVQETLAEDTGSDVKVSLSNNPGLCLDEERKLRLKNYVMENRHMFRVGGGA